MAQLKPKGLSELAKKSVLFDGGVIAEELRERGEMPGGLLQRFKLFLVNADIAWLTEKPDLTLIAVTARLKEKYDIDIHDSQISRHLSKMGWTRKAKVWSMTNKTAPTSRDTAPGGSTASP